MADIDSDPGPLVSCEWLQGKITTGDLGNTVILDVSWSSSEDCHQTFLKRHIPGARHLDVMVGPHSDLFPRSLPPRGAFQEAARAAGVCRDSRVVLYSDSDNSGFFLSCRAWWTFMVYGAKKEKVSVLDGGMKRWESLGYRTTSDTAEVKRGDFTASDGNQFRKTIDDMPALLTSPHPNVVDSRPDASFADGHIKGVVSLPASRLVDKDRQEMLDPQQLKQVMAEAKVDLNRPLITHCNSGMSSCTLAFAYNLCGGPDVSVYHGGFNEWKKKKTSDDIEKAKKSDDAQQAKKA